MLQYYNFQLPISLQSLLSKIRNGSGSCCPNSPPMDSLTCSDMATQTSPAISRSSSFTWVSDCDSPRGNFHVRSSVIKTFAALLLFEVPLPLRLLLS